MTGLRTKREFCVFVKATEKTLKIVKWLGEAMVIFGAAYKMKIVTNG